MVGPLPFSQIAQNAVGIPPLPGSTSNPSPRKRPTYHSADLYSRQAVSAKSQMFQCHSDHSRQRASIQDSAVAFGSDIDSPHQLQIWALTATRLQRLPFHSLGS